MNCYLKKVVFILCLGISHYSQLFALSQASQKGAFSENQEPANSSQGQRTALEKRLEMATVLKNKAAIADISLQLGEVLQDIGDLKKAEKHLHQSLEAYKSLGNQLGVARNYIAFGNLYFRRKESKKALKYVNDGLLIFEEAANKPGLAISYAYLGQVQLSLKLADEGKISLRKSLKLFAEVPPAGDGVTAFELAKKLLDEINETDPNERLIQESRRMRDSMEAIRMNFLLLQQRQRQLEQESFQRQRSSIENMLMSSKTISQMKRDSMTLALNKLEKEAALAKVQDSLGVITMSLEKSKIALESQQKLAESERNRLVAEQKLNFYLLGGGLAVLLLVLLFFWGRTRYKQRALDKVNRAYADLRQSNKELTETRDKLIESEKFKQKFLANMSHEIRTPMNAVVGMTNLLLNTKLDEQQAKYLSAIKQSANNLVVIINDILDLSKIEAGKMELERISINLHLVCDNVWNMMHLKALEKGLNFNLNISPDVPKFVLGDETRLAQILINLANNALKFTEKGSVEIKVSLDGKNEGINLVKFSVSDTGIGIPIEKQEQIFESFSQASGDTTRKFGGTGLGLTIAKHLVELHKGILELKSDLGKGSEFFFTIGYELGEGRAAEKEEIAEVSLSKVLHILLAEDNEFNQIVAVDTLEALFPGIVVDVAENGIIAIEKLKAKMYDLVLMDIQMPEMDGMEATKLIRQSLPEPQKSIKICAMTASVTKQEVDEFFRSGIDDVVAKPFEPQELKQKILAILKGT